MAEVGIIGEHFVQCGFTALRDPKTGGFLPSVPLYIRVDGSQVDKRTGLAECEKELCIDIAAVLAEKFGTYVRETRQKSSRKTNSSMIREVRA